MANYHAQNPGWTNSPARWTISSNVFGHATVTFSNNWIITSNAGSVATVGYRIVSRKTDQLVIRYDRGLDSDKDITIRFVENGESFWMIGGLVGLGIAEKFDRISSEQSK